ncbi:hypothetical protein [uncultured Roseibium sp.]|uniref:esterase/lipase family protein n=1 Tax=uncultured Roseibium sp. TaxID=1936171 RepID=UPI00321641FA
MDELCKGSDHSKVLCVLLHSYNGTPNSLKAVKRAVRETLPESDIWTPRLPAGVFSFADPEKIAVDLMERLDGIWRDNKSYRKIIFVGHSLGALLARKIYVFSCGETETAPFDPQLKADHSSLGQKWDWADQVERIVLLAGMNRGWRINHHLSKRRAAMWRIGGWVLSGLSLIRGRTPLIYSIRKGAPFITQLRIQSIAMQNAIDSRGVGGAMTIQLLGSVDDMVAPEDNVDLASGRNFIYLDVPFSGHSNVIELDDPKRFALTDGEVIKAGDARKAEFLAALSGGQDELNARAIVPSDVQAGEPNPDVDEVVFVIHGIRDVGYWTHKIARRVIQQAKLKGLEIKIATETSSYGFLPMLPFLIPSRRREKVEWLMDQYSEAKALYPNAVFSYVGHSNGTYLLAKALEQYQTCRFERAVFAGSVVSRKYRWLERIKNGQIKRVLNLVASRDLVVAVFPKGLQTIGWQDLGSAGHDGFDEARNNPQQIPEIHYVHGAHSTGLDERNWTAIAQFILGDQDVDLPSSSTTASRNSLAVFLGYIAPVVWLLLVLLVVGIGCLLWMLPIQEWQKTLVIVAYVLAFWKVITSL